MSRNSRKSIGTSFLHVMTQGIEKKYIFNCDEDIRYYINLINKKKDEYNIKVIAYCVMNNHAHLLLETKTINELSNFMHKINSAYGRYYNKKNSRVGFVFRDRFKSEGIYDEKHFYNCIHYIYNNPVVAGMCKTPEEYPYSNYRKLEREIVGNSHFIDTEEDLDIILSKLINEFLVKYNLNKDEMKKDKRRLKKILVILRENYHFSYDRLSKELQINKGVLYRVYHSK